MPLCGPTDSGSLLRGALLFSLSQGDARVQGNIELLMGPMRSNKAAELLRRADMRRQYAKQYVMVLKPSDDTKGGPGVVESRNPNGGGKMSAVEFKTHSLHML